VDGAERRGEFSDLVRPGVEHRFDSGRRIGERGADHVGVPRGDDVGDRRRQLDACRGQRRISGTPQPPADLRGHDGGSDEYGGHDAGREPANEVGALAPRDAERHGLVIERGGELLFERYRVGDLDDAEDDHAYGG